ncbi:MAG: lipopolysaccharide heptosyltransferase II [Bryobacteraceae bacterium]
MDFERILVRATNWIGDAVMSLPALHALRERFPKARISILARPWVAALYAREPFCNELIFNDVPPGNRGLKAKWHVAQQLRCRRFDCAILLQNAFEAAALAWLARIPIRIGYDRDARGWLLTKPIAVPLAGETPPHQRFYYLELLRRAGIISEYPPNVAISLSGAASAAREGRRRLQQVSLGRTIGVAPGAAYGGAKRWLTERFAESAVRLAQERQADVAIFGSAQESPICRVVHDLVASSGVRCLDMSGKTTLAELIELLAACDLCLTNDSGPMHIASALGVPTVAIFGATDAAATGPAGAHSRVVQEPVECSPCLLRECPIDHRCMTRVDSGRVVNVALDLLK